jgi:uncharacterized protein (UPF0332 family)
MITGDHFIALAGKLAAGSSPDAATCRTAVSRSYYGAFHLAKAFLVSLGVPISRSHGEVLHVLQEAGVARAREAGGHLSNLQSLRIKADYELASPAAETASAARRSVELAANIQSIIRELDTEANRPAVKAGAEAYLRILGRTNSPE